MRILFIHTKHIYVGHSSNLENCLKLTNDNLKDLSFTFFSTSKIEFFLEELIEILSRQAFDVILFDWIDVYTELFDLINSVAINFKLRILGFISCSFLRDPTNTKVYNNYLYLKSFNTVKFLTFDDLLNNKLLLEYSIYPIHDHQLIDYKDFSEKCLFCTNSKYLRSKPIISLMGNLTEQRNLMFFESLFNYNSNFFYFYLNGHFVNAGDYEKYIQPKLGFDSNIAFNPARPRNQQDFVHEISHLDYLIFDSRNTVDPSGVSQIFLKLGKGIFKPTESSSYLHELQLNFPDLPIYSVETGININNTSCFPKPHSELSDFSNSYSFNQFMGSLKVVLNDY